jgi:hypothetical protein
VRRHALDLGAHGAFGIVVVSRAQVVGDGAVPASTLTHESNGFPPYTM